MTAATPTRWQEYVALDDLPPAPGNPKDHDLGLLIMAITRFGWVGAVSIDERTGYLCAGHGRAQALRAMHAEYTRNPKGARVPDGIEVRTDGAWLVPVSRGWSSADDAHASAYRIADNKASERGGWDDPLLARALVDLMPYPLLLAAAGFDGDDVEATVLGLVGSETAGLEEILDAEDPKTEEQGDGLDDSDDTGCTHCRVHCAG